MSAWSFKRHVRWEMEKILELFFIAFVNFTCLFSSYSRLWQELSGDQTMYLDHYWLPTEC
jgi:hypothetical protein